MRLVPFALIIMMTTSCAGVYVEPVKNEHGSVGKVLTANDSGVRFFRPAPHVWITSAAKSEKLNTATQEVTTKGQKTTTVVSLDAGTSYSAQLVWLPDYSQEYIVRWKTGLGNVQPSFTLDQGWNLTKFESRAESRAAESIKETVGAITSLAPLAAGALLAQEPEFKGAGLYRLKTNTNGTLSLGALVLPLQ